MRLIVEYDPIGLLLGHQQGNEAPHNILLILNQPISSLKILKQLWDIAAYRICADGGANRLYDSFATAGVDDRSKLVRASDTRLTDKMPRTYGAST